MQLSVLGRTTVEHPHSFPHHSHSIHTASHSIHTASHSFQAQPQHYQTVKMADVDADAPEPPADAEQTTQQSVPDAANPPTPPAPEAAEATEAAPEAAEHRPERVSIEFGRLSGLNGYFQCRF